MKGEKLNTRTKWAESLSMTAMVDVSKNEEPVHVPSANGLVLWSEIVMRAGQPKKKVPIQETLRRENV